MMFTVSEACWGKLYVHGGEGERSLVAKCLSLVGFV